MCSQYSWRSALTQSGPASPLAQKNFNSVRGAMKLGHKFSRRVLAKHGKGGLGASLHVRAERSSDTQARNLADTPSNACSNGQEPRVLVPVEDLPGFPYASPAPF